MAAQRYQAALEFFSFRGCNNNYCNNNSTVRIADIFVLIMLPTSCFRMRLAPIQLKVRSKETVLTRDILFMITFR